MFSGITTGASGLFWYTFSDCTGLTSLPANLFSGITNSEKEMFWNTFRNCTGLTGYIPKTLFSGLIANGSPTASSMWNGTFYNTGSLATSCPWGTVQYTTGYESYWQNHKSCEPGAHVTYQCGSGASGTPPASVDVPVGASFTLAGNTCVAPNGYSFDAWRVSSESSNRPAGSTFTWNLMGDVYITAQYTPNTYNITYSCGTGTGTPPASTTVVYHSSFTSAVNNCIPPTGYSLGSDYTWYVGDHEAGIVGGTEVQNWWFVGDKVLTAHYEANTYTVTQDCGVGSGNGFSRTATYDSNFYIYNSNCVAPMGYSLTGWLLSGTNVIKPDDSNFLWDYAENKTFVAQYAPNTISVSFDNIVTNTCTYGQTVNVPTPAARTGQVFLGWKWKEGFCGLRGSETWSDGGYYSHDGTVVYNNTTYGLGTGEWALVITDGIIRGESSCNTTQSNTFNSVIEAVNNGTMNETDAINALYANDSDAIRPNNAFTNSSTGEFCWCKMNSYTPNAGAQCDVSSSAPWVYNLVATGANCSTNCTVYCLQLILYDVYSSFKRALFGIN